MFCAALCAYARHVDDEGSPRDGVAADPRRLTDSTDGRMLAIA